MGALLDQLDIEELCYRYSEALDSKNWDEFGACFVSQGKLHTASPLADLYGRKVLTEHMRTVTAEFERIQHFVSNCRYKSEGRVATGTSSFLAYHWKRGSGELREFVVLGGTYTDALVRKRDRWRFGERRIAVLWQHRGTELPASRL
jgi:3-phenylpropionate/cinnamic acid dioxygenase small subunit